MSCPPRRRPLSRPPDMVLPPRSHFGVAIDATRVCRRDKCGPAAVTSRLLRPSGDSWPALEVAGHRLFLFRGNLRSFSRDRCIFAIVWRTVGSTADQDRDVHLVPVATAVPHSAD